MTDYCLDEVQVGVLRRVEKALYSDKRLTDDQRRDCANTLNTVLGSVAPYREETVSKADKIVREHVKCNVTGLIDALAAHDDAWAAYILNGVPPEGYEAFEVWIVSHWLARQLDKASARVSERSYQHYWARGATGQAIAMDTVIEEIAREA